MLCRQSITALLYLFARHAKGLPRLGLVWVRLAMRSPRHAMGLLRNLPMIGEHVRAIDAGHVKHLHAYWLGWPARVAASLSALTGLPLSLAGHARDIFVEASSADCLVNDASFLCVCTENGRQALESKLGTQHASKLRLIRHGLLPEEMETPVPNQREKAGNELRLIAVGRLVKKKGFDDLLRAIKRLQMQRPCIHLTIIGEGPERPLLENLTRQFGLQQNLTLAGWTCVSDVLKMMCDVDMLVVPSIIADDGDQDGTPNVILEAFACGVPVIASRLPGIEEAIEHEVSGILVPAGDPECLAQAIIRLANDRKLMDTLRHGGRQMLMSRFDGMRNSIELLKLFREAMAG